MTESRMKEAEENDRRQRKGADLIKASPSHTILEGRVIRQYGG